MPHGWTDNEFNDLPEELEQRKRIIFQELKNRAVWFIKLRWFVPPSIIASTVVAHLLGFELASSALLFVIAAFILVYNTIFYLKSRNFPDKLDKEQRELIRSFTRWQVGFDYATMFLLIHYTGGITSPLIFFFIFHIIFASILLPPRSSYGFATLVVVGMIIIAITECFDWIPHYTLFFRGQAVIQADQSSYIVVLLSFFAASVFITAFSTTSIMTMLRKGITNLVDLSDSVKSLNNKLSVLLTLTQTIGSIRRLDQLLDAATYELANVMQVMGISIKLLSEDGRFLKYVASHGTVSDILKDKVIELAKSPLNRQVIEGKTFVTGRLTSREMFQFGEDLAAADVQSVLFVSLIVEGKPIGIMGAYCHDPERFTSQEVDFFRLAAGLIAMAIENARSYEAVEKLGQERSWFMLRVAHNLRAPLSAMLSILEVLRGEYLGDLNDNQKEYLRRIDRRANTMISMINELLLLAEKKNGKRQVQRLPVDLNVLAGRIHRTFKDEADQKGVAFEIIAPDNLPKIIGDAEMIEQALENLLSNAIKYTPSGGKVGAEFFVENNHSVRIQISDNGIGIPKESLPLIFNEFYRAENARSIEELGTGLGLVIVKEIVELHDGRIIAESEEGLGTLFVVHFPITGTEGDE